MLLTEQEIRAISLIASKRTGVKNPSTLSLVQFSRIIEAQVIKKIKAQGPEAWLHRQRTDSDVITTAVKHVWGNVAVGSLAAYDIPLYRLPEGD